jgi:hypothetical protein
MGVENLIPELSETEQGILAIADTLVDIGIPREVSGKCIEIARDICQTMIDSIHDRAETPEEVSVLRKLISDSMLVFWHDRELGTEMNLRLAAFSYSMGAPRHG